MAEEVREILLTNPAIAGEEPGRVVFALRGSRDDPDEFWIHDTWECEELVDAHESVEPFPRYKDRLGPLVDGSRVVWGTTEPFAVKGLEAAPIGKCYPRAGSSPGDLTAFVAPIDTAFKRSGPSVACGMVGS